MNISRLFILAFFGVVFALTALPPDASAGQERDEKIVEKIVNVYSYRQPFLISPLFELFEKETGIVVNVLFAKRGLIERIALEGRASPADLLLTSDIGQMFQAAESIGRRVSSSTLSRNIPARFRDSNKKWFALSKRARVVFVGKDDDDFDDITYESLGNDNLEDKVCMRDGQHPYNLALVAAMIAHHGSQKARTWLEGLKNNLARRPSGNDRLQVKGVFSGACKIALANTYYMGKMLTNDKNPEQTSWARAVRMIFPRFSVKGGGTHINFSGMVMTRYAPNRKNALKLMEFLSGRSAQTIYARENFEYPINAQFQPSPLVQSWGALREDRLSLENIARHRAEANLLVDETGFNE